MITVVSYDDARLVHVPRNIEHNTFPSSADVFLAYTKMINRKNTIFPSIIFRGAGACLAMVAYGNL